MVYVGFKKTERSEVGSEYDVLRKREEVNCVKSVGTGVYWRTGESVYKKLRFERLEVGEFASLSNLGTMISIGEGFRRGLIRVVPADLESTEPLKTEDELGGVIEVMVWRCTHRNITLPVSALPRKRPRYKRSASMASSEDSDEEKYDLPGLKFTEKDLKNKDITHGVG